MTLKGIRIEKGPIWWHVAIKFLDNKQGYVELEKFPTFEMASAFAKNKVQSLEKVTL